MDSTLGTEKKDVRSGKKFRQRCSYDIHSFMMSNNQNNRCLKKQ